MLAIALLAAVVVNFVLRVTEGGGGGGAGLGSGMGDGMRQGMGVRMERDGGFCDGTLARSGLESESASGAVDIGRDRGTADFQDMGFELR